MRRTTTSRGTRGQRTHRHLDRLDRVGVVDLDVEGVELNLAGAALALRLARAAGRQVPAAGVVPDRLARERLVQRALEGLGRVGDDDSDVAVRELALPAGAQRSDRSWVSQPARSRGRVHKDRVRRRGDLLDPAAVLARLHLDLPFVRERVVQGLVDALGEDRRAVLVPARSGGRAQ